MTVLVAEQPLTNDTLAATYWTWSQMCKLLDVNGRELAALIEDGHCPRPVRGHGTPTKFPKWQAWPFVNDWLQAETSAA